MTQMTPYGPVTPTRAEVVASNGIRCVGCRKKLAEYLDGRWHIVCPRCHRDNIGGIVPAE